MSESSPPRSQANTLTEPEDAPIVNLSSNRGEKLWLDHGFTGLVWLFAALSVATLLYICWVVYEGAKPAIAEFGLSFLWTREWNVPDLQFGALPFIYGTLVTSGLALLFAVPLGVSVAIVTSEDFLPEWVRSPLGFAVELIAAIPSVIVGLWGIFVMIPALLPFQLWLFERLSWIPLFKGDCFSYPDETGAMVQECYEPAGRSLLVAGIILTIMILPTVAAVSREVLQAIPKTLRSASMSLGATRWETIWRVMLPTGASGIVGASILALGRALGETMAVTMVIGNTAQITASLLSPGYTIPAVLANQFAEALDDAHVGALMYLALLLFVVTLVVNLIATFIVKLVGTGVGDGD
jgi:phosphate transport system permease protein